MTRNTLTAPAFPPTARGPRRAWGVLLAVLLLTLGAAGAQAQEQFFTQSGGRGLQNAKLNARMSKAEVGIGDLQSEMATIKPHARQEIAGCSGDGDKLRWDGVRWTCNKETDPTVQGWAKEALPSCGAGQILGASGGRFSCMNSGFVSTEMDPTVQPFAKQALPNCGAGQVLTVSSGGGLSCIVDERGLTNEADPHVHEFARNDKSSVPNCALSEVLTMINGRLQCRVDVIGVQVESDPKVQAFARNDVTGATLAACATGEVLRADTQGSNVLLACVSAQDAIGGALALDDLSDVTISGPVSGSILVYDGSAWHNGSESDPSVQTWAKQSLSGCTAGQVLSFNGSSLVCVNDAGGAADPLTLAGLSDVNVASAASGAFLKFDGSKWVPGVVQEFAQTALPVCATGQVLRADGTNLVCVNDAGGAADPVALGDLKNVQLSGEAVGQALRYIGGGNWANQDITLGSLSGVTLSSAASGQVLRFDGTGWVNSADKVQALTAGKWCQSDGTSVTCDVDVPLTCASNEVLCWSGTAWSCVNASTGLGLGTMAQQDANNVAITGGTINGTAIGGSVPSTGVFTNLAATTGSLGGLLVSGGSHFGGDVSVSGTTTVQGLHVIGNLSVSGSQTIDGVLFANGGIQLPGAIIADSISVTNVSATLADIQTLRTAAATINALGAGNINAVNVGLTGNLAVSGTTVLETAYTKDLHVGGNLYVSGSQSIDGVVFANGGIQMPGTLTGDRVSVTEISATVADIQTLRATNAGLTTLTANSAGFGLANIAGLLQAGSVSVSTNVSVTGNLSAANIYGAFHGDGSNLTNLPSSAVNAAGVAGSIQYKGTANELSGTSLLTWDGVAQNVKVAGTVQMVATAAGCASGDEGKMRYVNVGGGDTRLQLCRP